MKRIFRIFILLIALLLIGVGGAYYYFFKKSYSPKDGKVVMLIYPGKSISDVYTEVKSAFPEMPAEAFKMAAEQMDFTVVKPGRYQFKMANSIVDVIRKLKSGKQDAVRFSFVKFRTKQDLAAAIGRKTLTDSNEVVALLNDSTYLKQYGFNPDNALGMFIPNTYEVFWTENAKGFIARMHKEYLRFWTAERKKQAESLGLDPLKVSVLASIVNEETIKKDEKPKVAGLYWNRVVKGMLLQADPTVKFALGRFELRRIWGKDLLVDSKFNTYKYAGLPPGPINTPSIEDLEAVLNLEKHSFIYMCAKEDFSGYHNFAVTEAEHGRNADRYRRALSANKIYR